MVLPLGPRVASDNLQVRGEDVQLQGSRSPSGRQDFLRALEQSSRTTPPPTRDDTAIQNGDANDKAKSSIPRTLANQTLN